MEPKTIDPIALTDARRVVGQPDASHTPQLRLLAWSLLKSARGQSVRQSRLSAATGKSVALHLVGMVS